MTDYQPSQHAINKGRNLAVDLVTLGVLAAFGERGIDAILLKGPVHARWLYQPEHLRTYSDTDLLVAPDSVGGAEDVLSSLGFDLPDIYSGDDRPGHEHAWVRRKDGVRVDLHWNLIGSNVDDAAAWSVLSSVVTTMDLRGTDVKVLRPEGRALHVALHAAQHGSEFGTASEDLLRAVSIDRSIWAKAAALAERLGASASFSAGLRLDARGVEIADALQLPTEIPTDVSLRAGAAPAHALSLQWFMTQKGVLRKLRWIISNVAPSPSFMREWSPLARRGIAGLVLAYLYRPFYLLVRLIVAAKALRRAVRDAERAGSKAEGERGARKR